MTPDKQVVEQIEADWISVENELPYPGLKVRVKIDLQTGREHSKFEKDMHLMKHNKKWFDYDKYITHWKPIPELTAPKHGN